MNTAIKEVTVDELVTRYGKDDITKGHLIMQAKELKATEMVLMENLQMDSSSFGMKTIMMLGPTLTYKSHKDVEGQRLGDVPSRFQYPTIWAKVPQ